MKNGITNDESKAIGKFIDECSKLNILHVSNRISILSKRIHRLEDMYADICEKYGMWSYQAERCDKIIKKANDELVALYGC